MILEVAVLQIIEGQQSNFERDYKLLASTLALAKDI